MILYKNYCIITIITITTIITIIKIFLIFIKTEDFIKQNSFFFFKLLSV